MKVFAMMSSHRKNKNTEHLLDYFLEGLDSKNEIVKKRLVDLDINICTACEYCRDHLGECIFKDDMSQIIQGMLESDLIVLATPLYFNSVTTRLKIMIDRNQVLYNSWYHIKDPIFKERKPVVILSVGGSRHYSNQFEGVTAETQHFLTNIKGTLLDFIKYNNSDRVSLIDNEEVREEVVKKALEIEKIVNNKSWM
ncbi:multimeric flavodoxin WrbA [Alkalibaculum bacchi]|uniref:Multimeric flavodoxin WrbA n=1 Tax=Alkalibaculum bacchi TaxID=645887 RepID=A0A366HZ53_9FIRM|nr:flavodoxin family protein [Alkalibaculum bacchi]RBP58722.1 multimeric flavodoxin WrbA [Alkalibaculum bacchi]